MRRSVTLDAIRTEVERRGGSIETIAWNKQVKIVWRSRGGHKHVIVTAATPSDYRAPRNAAAMVRRQSKA
jgi:hypothetical protein